MKVERHPKLTPLRSLELFRKLVRARSSDDVGVKNYELSAACDQLEQHIKAVLVARRRK